VKQKPKLVVFVNTSLLSRVMSMVIDFSAWSGINSTFLLSNPVAPSDPVQIFLLFVIFLFLLSDFWFSFKHCDSCCPVKHKHSKINFLVKDPKSALNSCPHSDSAYCEVSICSNSDVLVAVGYWRLLGRHGFQDGWY